MDIPFKTNWLHNWHLVLMCVLSLAVFAIVKLPASILLPDTMKGHVTGTVWDAQAKVLSVKGYRLENVRVSVNFLPLFVGKISGNASVLGHFLQGKTDFKQVGSTYQFQNFSFKNREIITLVGQPVSVSSEITAPQLNVDNQGRCVGGGFKLKTSLLQDLFSKIDKIAPVLNGIGTCQQGKLHLELDGQSNKMAVQVAAVIDEKGRLVADVVFREPSGSEMDVDIQQLLRMAGLKTNGAAFQGQVALDLMP